MDGLLSSVRLLAMAVVLPLCGCSGGQSTICSAVGWLDTLTVELAAGWPTVPDGSVTVECPSACVLEIREDAPPVERDENSVPLAGASTPVTLTVGRPESVVVTVTAADGTDLARHEADLTWRREGGSEECGGPHGATVVVPAPDEP
jgi:hypothetical protein